MARRSRAREVALQLLFQKDLNPTLVPRAAIEQFVRDQLLGDAEMTTYCLGIYDGTLSHQPEIDPQLTATATNWRLSRMLPVDRNILRMAAYELLFDSSKPPLEVVIHEANELAARFGSADSAKFVNGILDKIAKTPPQSSGFVSTAITSKPTEVTSNSQNENTEATKPEENVISIKEPLAINLPPLPGQSLRHKIGYHNIEFMGRRLTEGNPKSIMTSKPTGQWVGDVVWFIEAENDSDKARQYTLASVFVVDEVGEDQELTLPYFAKGKKGHVFQPPIALNNLPWFVTLRKLVNNFSLCPQTIKDHTIIRELLALATAQEFSPLS